MKGVKESEGKLHIFSPMTVIQTDRQTDRQTDTERKRIKIRDLVKGVKKSEGKLPIFSPMTVQSDSAGHSHNWEGRVKVQVTDLPNI